MNFAKNIRVGEESAQAGICAKEKRPPAVLGRWEILWVGIAEDASAQGCEYFGFCFYRGIFTHE
jgi:hypothetical protein